MTNELKDIASSAILKMANSSTPGVVLAQAFEEAFQLGVQEGLRRTTDSLEKMTEPGWSASL